MKKKILLTLISLCVLLFTSCSAYMHGYTKQEASNRYLQVDKKNDSLGYKRLEYNLSMHDSLKGFIKTHGIPQFIYEYSNEEGHDSIRMYYTNKDLVYIYEAQSWLADSLYLKEQRSIDSFEKMIFKGMFPKF